MDMHELQDIKAKLVKLMLSTLWKKDNIQMEIDKGTPDTFLLMMVNANLDFIIMMNQKGRDVYIH